MRADQPAPATSRPAARTPATRAAAKSRLTGKPAVRLSVTAAKRKKSGGAPAEAEAAAGTAPKEPPDPRLTQAISKVKRNAKKLKKHDPARDKADQAQDAAEPPEKEVLSRAQANKVGEIKSEMDAAKKPSVDEKPPQEKSFLETLEEEIERVMPKKIEDTENFMDKEDRKNLKDSMSGNIEAQKQQVTGPVKATANAKPDEEAVTPKPVITPLPEALPKAATEPVGARNAMPEPLPDEKVSLQSSKDEAQRQFDENKITPTQLQKANDPRFTAALKAKEDVDAHADAAPQQYREVEQKTLTTAVGRAVAAERRGTSAMLGAHDKSGGDVRGDQGKAMKDDKDRRQEVVDFIEKKFAATKESVETKLATLESEVTTMFDEGIEKNIKSMKDEATRKKDDWKEDRYYWHGIMNRPDLWLYDKVRGIDRQPKVKKIYVEAAEQFTRDMKALVKRIATFVETRLKEAKDEVEKGRKEIHDFVSKLDGKLKDVGLEAEKAVSERFDELTQSIEDKKKDLASNLAQRYKDAHDKAGEAIKEMQAEDKGLIDALLDKLKEIIEILRNFKRRIMSMLRKAASAIDLIISDPIGFLKNLLKAIKQGISQFVGRIWTHLKEGFIAWLFGSLATMGVTIPKDLSLPSILQLVLDVLGITYAKIRGKVAKIVGERNVAMLEAAWGAVETLLKGGPAALWEQIKEYFSNLKEMVVDAIQNWLITRIIESAATKIAMMFNPAGAIIQAILMIYRTVMFFIENIDRILAFVESIIESVYNIATGAIGAAADWIEKALARTIPIIIAFLARLLGISGLADKIKEFINRIQTRIDKAIDKVIDKLVGGVKKLLGRDTSKPAPQPGAQRADDPSPTAEEKFTIGTESHELKGEFVKGKFVILMASGLHGLFKDKVKEVRVAWFNIYQKQNAGKVAGNIDKELKKLETRADRIASDAEKMTGPDPTALHRAQSRYINQEIDKLAVELKDICDRFGIVKVAGASDYKSPPAHVPVYSNLKPYGRARHAHVTLSFNSREHMRRTSSALAVPGTHIGDPAYQKGHLLAASLGGSNTEPRNFVPMSQGTNTKRGGMEVREKALRTALREDVYPPWIINYSITANYKDDEGAFRSWIEGNVPGATPGAQSRLFNRAMRATNRGSQITDADLVAELVGPRGTPPAKPMPRYLLDEVREKLLFSFTARTFTASISIEQAPIKEKDKKEVLPASQTFDNHQ